jgi:hypothetical protein
MNTFLKITLGFVLGVIFTFGVLYILGKTQNTEENKLREEIRMRALNELKQSFDKRNSDEIERDITQSFELTTKTGIVKLHTNMLKDSVQILMGRPESTDVNSTSDRVYEEWKYKGANEYRYEFTIEFMNGRLKSVRQYKEN